MNELIKCPIGHGHEDRSSLTNAIQIAKRDGHIVTDSDAVLPHPHEVRASIAIFSDELIERAQGLRETLPPYGLGKLCYDNDHRQHTLLPITELSSRRPFDTVRKGMSVVLSHAESAIIRDYYLKKNNPLLASAVSILERHNTSNPSLIIENGIGTAVGFMSNTLEVLPKIQGFEALTSDELIKISQKNITFINMLTQVDRKIISQLVTLLQDGREGSGTVPFNPDYFISDEQGVIDLSGEFCENAKNKLGDITFDSIGCPARYTRAIKDLWGMHIDLAQEIWKDAA